VEDFSDVTSDAEIFRLSECWWLNLEVSPQWKVAYDKGKRGFIVSIESATRQFNTENTDRPRKKKRVRAID